MRKRTHPKSLPSGEGINVDRSIEWLAQWAIDNGEGIVDAKGEVIADAPLEYFELFPIWVHLHDANGPKLKCSDDPCKKLAVCRALRELSKARDSPLKCSIRKLAQTVFQTATPLEQLANNLEERIHAVEREFDDWATKADQQTEQSKLELEAERIRLGLNALEWTPMPSVAMMGVRTRVCTEPIILVSNLRYIATCVRELDWEIRAEHLTAPRDRSHRQAEIPGKLADTLLIAVTQHLHHGGFKPREIAQLVDAGDGGQPLPERAKHVSDRLYRHMENDCRTKFLKRVTVKNEADF